MEIKYNVGSKVKCRYNIEYKNREDKWVIYTKLLKGTTEAQAIQTLATFVTPTSNVQYRLIRLETARYEITVENRTTTGEL